MKAAAVRVSFLDGPCNRGSGVVGLVLSSAALAQAGGPVPDVIHLPRHVVVCCPGPGPIQTARRQETRNGTSSE